MIELYSFGKWNIIPHLKHTAGTPTPPFKLRGLPFCSLWLQHAEFSLEEGSECCTELGLWKYVSQGGFCLGIKWVGAVLYGYIAVGGDFLIVQGLYC